MQRQKTTWAAGVHAHAVEMSRVGISLLDVHRQTYLVQ
jgi:hypothetical protein